LKEDISKPIAAILILNTIANTAGASLAGWAAGEAFGADFLVVFSFAFTLVILYFSEIVPKLVGVVYCKQISLFIAYPLSITVIFLKPLILISDRLAAFIKRGSSAPSLTPEEIRAIATTGTEEGALDHFEGSVIANVIGLDETLVKDVLTPRVVVHRLNKDTKLKTLENDLNTWQFSRVPLFNEDEPEHLIGYVTQRDVAAALLEGKKEIALYELMRPLKVVPELMRVDKLLLEMFAKREHICAVVDEHGALAGIITLEDIIEEIVGREIVDEYDSVSDLRTFAKLLGYTRSKKKR
jgi:CBS domain containing-hemolysin-like protein